MKSRYSPYVSYRKDLRGVRSLWERFNAGLLDGGESRLPYHKLLLDDWQRCTALGIDVAMSLGRRLSPAEFQRRREAEQLLVDTSLPILRDVGDFLVDVPGILILTERTGTILQISGDASVQERTATKSGIVVGSEWNEHTAGTNGVGTALARREPVHVFAAEHFCEGWHSWSCAASPIFDADGRTVLGIIDFTSIETDFRDQALGLAVSLANSIQSRIALHRELERRCLLMAFSEASRRYPHDDLVALDTACRPVAHTPNERCRQLAERWSTAGAEVSGSLRTTIEVNAPGTGARVGSIALLARPIGYQRVFRDDARPATPLALSDPVARFGEFVSRDPDTRRMLEDLQRLAGADVNVLIHGETGTGKELIARHLHEQSPRHAAPYLPVNCGAISEHLMESTFFGYVKGAFSGADPRGRAGYFESTENGTLFLDELGELPLAMQAALLRVLEDGSFMRVGSCQPLRARCRVIAATHRDLESEVAEGRFRRDLYYRLKIVQRSIKPLRERPCDIELLAGRFAESLRCKHGLPSATITPAAHEVLLSYAWPGNARELRNALEAALLCSDGVIEPACLPPELLRGSSPVPARGDAPASASEPLRPPADGPVPESAGLPDPAAGLGAVKDYERQIIIGMLRRYGRVSRAATALGIARSTLYRKFAELEIQPQDVLQEPSGADPVAAPPAAPSGGTPGPDSRLPRG